MYISRPNDFIVKVTNSKIENLDVIEMRDEIENSNYSLDKEKLKENVVNLMTKVSEIVGKVTKEDLLRLHHEGFKTIFYYHINTVEKLKNKSYSKDEINSILDEHINKFDSIFNFHFNTFKCDDKDVIKPLSDSEFIVMTEKINNEIYRFISKLQELLIGRDKNNKDEIINIHMMIFNIIKEFDVENIMCFNLASKKLNMKVVENIHNNKIREVIKKHFQ